MGNSPKSPGLFSACLTQTCYHLSSLISANFLQLLCSNWRNIMNLSPFKLDIDDLIYEFAKVPHSIEHNLLFSTCSVLILRLVDFSFGSGRANQRLWLI